MKNQNKLICKKSKIDITNMTPIDQLQNFFDQFNSEIKVLDLIKLDESTFTPIFKIEYQNKIYEIPVSRVIIEDMKEFWKSEEAISDRFEVFLDINLIKECKLRVYTKILY